MKIAAPDTALIPWENLSLQILNNYFNGNKRSFTKTIMATLC